MVRPKRLGAIVAAFMAVWMVVLSLGSNAAHAAGTPGGEWTENSLGLNVTSAILIAADTGQVIYEVNADAPRSPASMTKLMTEYIVLDQIASGKLSWDTMVTVSKEAASTPADGSQIYLAEGDQHTVKQLYIAMAVGSANDATVALADQIAGTEAKFVDLMNETAQKLGLKTAHYTSATGLAESTVISARDMASLARTILTTHKEFLDYSTIQSYKFRERDKQPMINNNWMLASNASITNFKQYAYPGVDGMKTGYTSAAGYTFTGTVMRDGVRYISVVMNADSKGSRFTETAKLYDYVFSNIEKKVAVPAKTVVETTEKIKIKKGKKTTVPVVTDADVSFYVKKGTEPKIELSGTTVATDGQLVAPIQAGQKIGTATYKYTDDQGKSIEQTVNLVASEQVDKASWIRLLFRGIKDFFVDLFDGIVNLF
ncbi:D-alanyl-D-alanine carboxypeptidase family protein [Paenibacillus protaetiae]|uniref:serine-type D-Ala-D-Ala carboxypeptidase n=1 Tax=Paenibacillus protaetiae TaxID=2509456 RepID=A0A4P6F038_9BACL|nr:D-alanyl-D-alanine carboxypeptidase family protein [Paenibacillus protaetiae]QAY68526.1 D-alanyl-D-alanine carboxypeptidase [Paenibacillus protaetiae]